MEIRDYYYTLWRELAGEKAMVFLAGPRQAGKTTLAKAIAIQFANQLYFNWDIASDQVRLLKQPDFFTELTRHDTTKPLIVFDELHKYVDWKNYLKGIYDQYASEYQFLVTGSGRLDTYQKGGDSLAGRYYLFYLWPFTLGELHHSKHCFDDFIDNPLTINQQNNQTLVNTWQQLMTLSGFPEPFLTGRETSYRRWSITYAHQLIREDIRDFSGIRNIAKMETLYNLLPSKIGSPLSITSLAHDLKLAYNSVAQWIEHFERFFIAFSITPWTKKIARAIQKERKIYLWDTPRITDPGARFENQVALELKRAVTAWRSLGYGDFSLHFIKNKEQQEVDFLIAKDNEPLLLIEAKHANTNVSSGLKKIQGMLQIPAVQLVANSHGYQRLANQGLPILVVAAYQWLANLP